MKNLSRIMFALLATAFTLVPAIISAQTDPRCWDREACIAARAGFNLGADQRPEDGFYSAAQHSEAAICGEKDAQGNELGFCLPATKTVTEISFGGKREFANIGEFIQLAYRYAIIIAGILATVVIMLAGIRWTASGGNAERIKSAQKMIGGAIAGLLIALLSYTILNVLNPATVNLRLPQVWLIRAQALPARYCDQVPAKENLAKIEPKGATLGPAQRSALKFDKTRDTAECGYDFALSSSNQTCIGVACVGLQNVCAPSEQGQTQCQPGAAIAGTITAVQGFFSGTDLNQQEKKIIDGPIELLALCKDGTIKEIGSTNASNRTTYSISLTSPSSIKTVCDNSQGLAGFFLGAEVNDEGTGLIRPGDPLTTGVDDWHAIGQLKEGSHVCKINLAKIAYFIENGQSPPCKANECSCAFISAKGFADRLADNPKFTQHLLTEKELTKGYVCDITISRNEFPAVDNSSFTSRDAALTLFNLVPGLSLYVQGFNLTDRFFRGSSSKEGAFTTCTEYQ